MMPPASFNYERYTTQGVHVWGCDLNLMHPVEQRISVTPQGQPWRRTFPWQKEAFAELLAQKAMQGEWKLKQPAVTQTSQTVWLPTVEASGYIKAGGLAEVPVGLARSFLEAQAQHGGPTPLLVMPLYVGTQRVNKQKTHLFLEEDARTGQLQYCHVQHSENTPPKLLLALPVTLVFEFTLPVADLERTPDGDEVALVLSETEHAYRHMCIRVYETQLNGLPLLLIHHEPAPHTRSFFDISTNKPLKSLNPYVGSRFAEIRRFTFFSRVLNAVQWALVDAQAQAYLNRTPAPQLALPDALLLNDWQVGAVAALSRYTAYYQAEDRYQACVQQASTLTLQQQTWVHQHYTHWGQHLAKQQQHHVLLHNFAYQGEHPNHRLGDHQKTEYLYNLLFDTYAARVMKLAHAPNEASVPPSLMKNIAIENRFNLLRMAVGCADTLVAVSPNYAQELAKHESLGGVMRPLLAYRQRYGTLRGITNGYDKADLLPTEAWLAKHVGATLVQQLKEPLLAVNPAWATVQTYSTQQGKQADARLPVLSNRSVVFGSQLQKEQQAFLKVRQHNQAQFRSWLAQVHQPTHPLHEAVVLRDITDASVIEAKAPIFYTVGRLVDQKGFDQFALAIEALLNRLHDENTVRRLANEPLLPLPGVVVQGSGDETYRRPWLTLKEQLVRDKRGKQARAIVLLDTPDAALKNMAMLGSDYFVVASKFEPCGLVQMEALACGTPVVATHVGGLKDTISHGNTGYLTPNAIWFNTHLADDVEHNAQLLAEELWRAYTGYSHTPTAYQAMQIEAISQNFSWSLGPLAAYQALLDEGRTPSSTH